MSGRSELEQEIVNRLKIARSAIRLKYALAADTELNEVLPMIRVQLEGMAQRGELPALTTPQLFQLIEDSASAAG